MAVPTEIQREPEDAQLWPEEMKNQVNPIVWAAGRPGRAKPTSPIRVDLKPGAGIPSKKQYPLRKEALEGIPPIIQKLQEYGLIPPCRSPYNTPILPIRKPHSNEYRFVQDLRAISDIVQDIHPTVPNPYTLVNSRGWDSLWCSVPDLKDAFFCVPVDQDSQPLFAFEWQDPESQVKTQHCWVVLPQGFKNSPSILGETLS